MDISDLRNNWARDMLGSEVRSKGIVHLLLIYMRLR